MSRNTAALVASFQAAPEIPADGNERAGVNWVRDAAARTLPHVPADLLGDMLMHFVCFFDTLLDTVSEADPMLDWESRTHIVRNMIGVAGMEMYTGTGPDATGAAAPDRGAA